MTNIAIIYYSTYGHIATMAESVKKGVESVDGVTAEIYQVQETLSEEILTKMHAAPKRDYPVATPDILKNADGVLLGIPTRFGSMPAQVKALFDACGGLWAAGALVGKPAGIFFSTGTIGGGQETTAFTSVTFLTHQGMTFVPLGYRSPLLFNMEEIHGGSPWGAGTLAGGDGSRQPSKLELDVAKVQGESFATVAKKLSLIGANLKTPFVQRNSNTPKRTSAAPSANSTTKLGCTCRRQVSASGNSHCNAETTVCCQNEG